MEQSVERRYSVEPDLLKGDIVKITSESTDRLGLISEVVDGRMIRVGTKWYETDHFEIEVLYRES